MGTTTNGQICYGFVLEDGVELPWHDEKYDGETESWWRDVKGYEPILRPFTPAGNYAQGWTGDDPRFEEYFKHRRAWEEANPIPIEMVNYCSGDCPMWVVAVPGTFRKCLRGYPEKFDPDELRSDGHLEYLLRSFCEEHGIELQGDPGWILSSYWG